MHNCISFRYDPQMSLPDTDMSLSDLQQYWWFVSNSWSLEISARAQKQRTGVAVVNKSVVSANLIFNLFPYQWEGTLSEISICLVVWLFYWFCWSCLFLICSLFSVKKLYHFHKRVNHLALHPYNIYFVQVVNKQGSFNYFSWCYEAKFA